LSFYLLWECYKKLNTICFAAGLGNRFRKGRFSSALAVLWCLISVVFIYAYIGTWTSFLTVPKLQKRIYSLEDLPTSGLNWVVIRGHSLQSLFMVGSLTTHEQNITNLVIHSHVWSIS
jgi:hypothetical protein